jgi:tetrahydromethanopterin S-methyltransferase subunit G
MHIHLPQVPQSWRALGREIGIIVIGVLIALLFQQLAEAWDWDQKVDAADHAMRSELLTDDGPQIYLRAALHPCVEARLDDIRSAVESGAPRAEIGRRIDQYWTPFFTYDSVAYTTAEASQVSLHFDPKRLQPFNAVYSSMPLLDEANRLEGRDKASLHAFRRGGDAVSAEEADRLLSAVEALRNDDRTMWGGAQYAMPSLRAIGTLDRHSVDDLLALGRQHYGACVKALPPDFPGHMLAGA